MARFPNRFLFSAGTGCMILAVALENITLGTQRYGPTLLTALGLTAVANACLLAVAWRGPIGWRVAAVLLMLPTLYIVSDFARRAPYVF